MNLDELVVTPQGTTVQPVSGASSNWTSEYDSEREMQGHPERIKYNDDRAKLIDNLWRNGGVDPITGKVFDNSTSKALDAATVGVGTAIAAPFVAPAIGSALAPPVAKTIAAQQAFAAAHPYWSLGINGGLTGLGIYDLASGNGVQKTYRLAKTGDTWGAIKSGTGDALNLVGTIGFLGDAYRLGKQWYGGLNGITRRARNIVGNAVDAKSAHPTKSNVDLPDNKVVQEPAYDVSKIDDYDELPEFYHNQRLENGGFDMIDDNGGVPYDYGDGTVVPFRAKDMNTKNVELGRVPTKEQIDEFLKTT